MKRDLIWKNDIISMLDKLSVFFGHPMVQFVTGILFAAIGYFLGKYMQSESNNLIYELLWFFVGIVFADKVASCNSHKEIMGEDSNSENIIVNLLNYLTEQVYNRCSNSSEHCGQCGKFASEDDGLIRRYLYEESQHLRHAILKSKDGEYSLDNNIRRFHTFAITHMLNTFGEQYSVIQWIGTEPYTDQHKYDETYNTLDFDFLETLLKKVTERGFGKSGAPYYKIKLSGGNTFKIKWILIGDLECMKNNFDYIFFVIKKLISKDNLTKEIIDSFFEFYYIGVDKYKERIDDINKNFSIDSYKSVLHLSKEPSFGIFGNQFMFIDSLDEESHGSIYTKKYVLDESSKSLLDISIMIFSEILSASFRENIDDLMTRYNKIIEEDKEWENQLNSIWKNERKRR